MPTDKLPKVTTLTTAYNDSKYLPKALESVLSQNYPNIEILVVDDGSMPRLEPIVRAVSDSIRYEWIEHKGIPHGLIRGMEIASGEYVAILDSDDMLMQGSILKRVERMQESPAGLCYGRSLLMDEDSRVYAVRPDKVCKDYMDVARKLLVDLWGPFTHGSIMFNRKNVLTAGNYDKTFSMCEDNELSIRVAKQFGVTFTDEFVMKYRTHDNNISRRIASRIALDDARFRMIDMYIENPLERAAYKTATLVINMAKTAYLSIYTHRKFGTKRLK